jgi:hypothetical protein
VKGKSTTVVKQVWVLEKSVEERFLTGGEFRGEQAGLLNGGSLAVLQFELHMGVATAGGLWETGAWQSALFGSLRISGALQRWLSARFAVRHSRLLWAHW